MLSLVLCLASVLPPNLARAQVRLPTMGDGSTEDLPVGIERRYGEQIMREVWRDPAYLDDPVMQAYVESLWAPLLEAARRRGDIDEALWSQFAWRIFLVQDRSVNAFALPGGFVGVHLGLIAMTASSDELASVMGHELSHVSQRHIARSITSANRQGAASMVAMLLGILAASRSGNADMAQAAIVGSQAATVQGQLNFSRDMEREADRIGFGIFSDAGFAPEGMAGMFDKLEYANRLNDSGAYPYLRSHPLTIERVSEARTRATVVGLRPVADRTVHHLMQARARALMDRTQSAWSQMLAAARPAAETPAQPGPLYGAALAATLMRDWPAADGYLARLRLWAARHAVDRPAVAQLVELLTAESMLARGDAQAALAHAQRVPKPADRAALLMHAAAAVRATGSSASIGRALSDADQALRTRVADFPADAAAWDLLAEAAQLTGRNLQALRARAEARAARGDLSAAVDLLRSAQRLAPRGVAADFADVSVIDARLREIEERRRSQAVWLSRQGVEP